ncbi:hypothetical protein [Nocardioides sp. P5_E3]
MTRPTPLDYFLTAALVAVGIWELLDDRVVLGIGFVVLGLLALASARIPRVQSVMAWPRRRREDREGDEVSRR